MGSGFAKSSSLGFKILRIPFIGIHIDGLLPLGRPYPQLLLHRFPWIIAVRKPSLLIPRYLLLMFIDATFCLLILDCIFKLVIAIRFPPFLTSSGKRYLHSILSQIRSKALWRASIYHVTSFETLCLSPDGCWLSLVFIRFGLLCFLIHRDVRASLWPSPHSTSWAICPKRLLGRAVKPSGTELPSILKTPKPFWAMPS